MSIIDTNPGGIASLGLAVGANFAANLLGAGSVVRSIGGIVAACTLEEDHEDELELTDHPVELGASITDHAFKKPVRVRIIIGWGAGQLQPLSQIYAQLLALQASAKPFSIVTGKRKYRNMLITALGTQTDADTENVLRVVLQCREVIIVQTQVTNMPPAANQSNPQATAAPQNSGTVQTTPANNVPTGGALPVGTSNSHIYVKVTFPGH